MSHPYWQRGADRDDLLRLLKELKENKVFSNADNNDILKNAKEFFTSGLDWLDNVGQFWDFKDLFPKLITDEDITAAKYKFVELAWEDVSYSPEDPDVYREDSYQIEKFAKRFNVDMSERIEELESRAKELEEERRFEPDDYEGGHGSGHGSESCSDYDIDSLFSTLAK